MVLQHNTPSSNQDVVLVIGGTGGTGAIVVRRLLELPSPPAVRVMSRSGDEASVRRTLGQAVQVVRGDVADRQVVRVAMDDVTHVVYVVGPRRPALSGPTMEGPYVTGLRNVLEAGHGRSMRQVVLLSAQDCESPWGLMRSVPANTLFGLSSLMHLRQERLLREHAAAHEGFGYAVLRPPIFKDTEAGPEPVAMATVGARGGWACGPTVSRAAVAEVMLHALLGDDSKRVTLELSSSADAPAPADFDWAAHVAALHADVEDLPPVEGDVWHARVPRMFALGIAMAIGAAIALPLALS
jgi:uncharacterized protein YbjT (DUF2867 family)